MLDSVIPHQAPADSKVPFGKFSPSFPGQVVDGTEDAKVFAIPNSGLRPLICSYSFKGGRYCRCHYVSSNSRRIPPAWYSIDESEL